MSYQGTERRMQNNGYIKWWQAISAFLVLMGITVTIGIFSTGQAIAIDERSNQRDQVISKTLDEHITKLMEMVQDVALDVRELRVKLGGISHESSGVRM